MALLVAMQLILTRVLVIEIGPNYRITVGAVCTVLAGLWMGPAAGGICGLCADVVGCFLKGYAVNPIITIAAILWGVVPALAKRFYMNRGKKGKTVGICISIYFTGILSTLFFTTMGLVVFYGSPLLQILPGRIVQYLILMPVYCVLTCVLYFSPVTGMVKGTASPVVLKDKTV